MLITLGTTPAVQKTLTFDRLTIDDVNRTADVASYASGKSINAARVLHALGKPVLALCFAGGDTGAFLRRDLDKAGIAHSLLTVDADTRTATTVIDRAAGTATELIEEPSPVSPRDYEALLGELQRQLPLLVEFVLLCGSLPPGAPPNFYARCVAACRQAKVPVLLDATGEPLRQALAERPTVVKPNRRELADTLGISITDDRQLRQAISDLLSRGPQWAAITAGPGATIASDGREFWAIHTPPVPVISAIGSGDAFAAGLAAGLSSWESLPDAARLGAACGAANAMTARAGHLDPAQLHHLAAKITVSPF